MQELWVPLAYSSNFQIIRILDTNQHFSGNKDPLSTNLTVVQVTISKNAIYSSTLESLYSRKATEIKKLCRKKYIFQKFKG